ncbi:MAG: hypothetical protein KGS45_10575 [Planctomycetes bacterium]|nr:hypothetical protein [Planctomycetota bacterium]
MPTSPKAARLPLLSLFASILCLVTPSAHAQWSSNPFANRLIADRANDQVQPKIAITTDGGCYISWFDNASGGYDVYLQRLDPCGREVWARNGLLLADRAVSSTTDYDLTVDDFGNALIVWTDDFNVSGATQQVVVQKVSLAGQKLWGPNGITATSDTAFKGNPKVIALSDTSVIVAWTANNIALANRYDFSGNLLAANLTLAVEASRYIALSDLEPTGDGFVALWVRGTTTSPITSAKALYSQKFSNTGAAQWNAGAPVIVFNTTSVQNGYFPTCLTDGNGGAIYGWYETGGSRNAYIQHVLTDGTLKFPVPIANTGATPNRIRISAGLAFDPVTSSYYLASTESGSPTQGNYSVIVQRFDEDGTRLWTDTGTIILPTGTGNQSSFVQCVARPGEGCIVFGIDSRTSTTGVIFAAGVHPDGTVQWSNLPGSTISGKGRLTGTASEGGGAFLTWHDGATGSTDIRAQNVSSRGRFGLASDFNADDVVDFFDYLDFVAAFAAEDPTSDFNADGVIDFFDYLDFVASFSASC